MSAESLPQGSIRRVASPQIEEPPPGLFSNCLVADGVVYVSGQHAGTRDGAVGGPSMFLQAREAFRRVLALVGAAGGRPDQIVKLTIFVTDITRRAEISEARREIFADPFPCSTLVGVASLVDPGLLIEIEAVAVLGAAGRRKST